MRRGNVRYRVRLAGLDVHHADGEVVRIPWTELHGPLADLRPSGVARVLDPRLPKRLRLPSGVGQRPIRRLRLRAAERALRDGTYDRFWAHKDVFNPGRVLLLTAMFVAFVGWYFVQQAAFMLPAISADDNGELVRCLWRNLWIWAGFSVLVLLSHTAMHWRGRGRRALALRTGARGIEYHFDDGQTVFRPWSDVARVRRDWPSSRKFLSISRAGCELYRRCTDWNILCEALQRWQHPETIRRIASAQEIRSNWRGAPLLTLIFVGLGALAALMMHLGREEALARGQRALSLVQEVMLVPAFGLLGSALVPAGLSQEYGVRRGIIRPLRRMLGRRRSMRRSTTR